MINQIIIITTVLAQENSQLIKAEMKIVPDNKSHEIALEMILTHF